MKVKVCGITDLEDAEEAVRLGAWAIGLNYHRPSPRSVRAGVGAEIGNAMRRKCEVVGVFVNPTLERVSEVVEEAGLTMVQLSGEEGPAFCTEVARRTGLKVIKAIHVTSAADLHRAEPFRTDWHLFDSRRGALRGGTGEAFDWELMRRLDTGIPFLLAGGLNPENVSDAIETARPDAVDVASGVESAPGRKDPGLMEAFFTAANRARVGA